MLTMIVWSSGPLFRYGTVFDANGNARQTRRITVQVVRVPADSAELLGISRDGLARCFPRQSVFSLLIRLKLPESSWDYLLLTCNN